MDQSWCKHSLGICLGNNQDNFQLHSFTRRENTAKSVRGLLFLTHTVQSQQILAASQFDTLRGIAAAGCVCVGVHTWRMSTEALIKRISAANVLSGVFCACYKNFSLYCTRKRDNCEALQLEGAQVLPPSCTSLQIQQFCRAYFSSRWTFTMWPWPLMLWPWTLQCIGSHVIILHHVWTKWNNPQPS